MKFKIVQERELVLRPMTANVLGAEMASTWTKRTRKTDV